MTFASRFVVIAGLALALPLAACDQKPAAPAQADCQTPEVKTEIAALEAKLQKLASEVVELQTNHENANEFLAQEGLSPADKKEGETQLADLGKKLNANAADTQATQLKLDKLKALKTC